METIPDKMYLSKETGSWKWRRYRCKRCDHVTTYNMRDVHMSRKHPDEWRANESIDAFFEPIFENESPKKGSGSK